MQRAPTPREEAAPARPPQHARTTSLESLLALGLCAVVLLASVAFLERSRELSRTLAGLGRDESEAARARPPRPLFAGERPKLVILISLDTLRADRLDLYGYERETAPELRRMGEESVVFRVVASQTSQTLTSHKSLFTGKYPATLMLEETGADLLELATLDAARDYVVDTFSAVRATLPQGFRERGYRTAAFTDGAWMSREAGFEHGFDQFDDSGGGLAAVLPRGLAWLDVNATQPAFLFLHAYDVHCPYSSPEPFDSAFCDDHARHIPLADKCGKGALAGMPLARADVAAISDHYDGSILSADHLLGRFLDELRARGLYERALIVVTSDHGESLGERGVVGHGGLYLEQLMVPLIVKFPRASDVAPRMIDEPVELIDLLPTLFTLCGIPTSEDLDGSSLLPIVFRGVRGKDTLLAQTSFEEAPELATVPAKRTLLRPGHWQLIHDAEHARATFFALEHDPHGLVPHAVLEQEFPSLLRVLTEPRSPGRRAGLRPREPVRFSDELEHELRQLGYHGGDEPEDETPRALASDPARP